MRHLVFRLLQNRFTHAATAFALGAATTEAYRRRNPAQIDVAGAADVLAAQILAGGWKPIDAKGRHGLTVTASIFPTALVSNTAYVVVQHRGQHYVLLNVEKRGGQKVGDVPCGFQNSGDVERLARNQAVLARRGKIPASERTPDTMLQSLMRPFKDELDQATEGLDQPPVDSSTQAGMERELKEETGLQIPDGVTPKLILLNNVEKGRRFYPRYLTTWTVPDEEKLPTLTPEGGNISKSQWVPMRHLRFQYGSDGLAQAGEMLIGRKTYPLKPSDDTAKDLAYAIGLATGGKHGSDVFPGEELSEPGVIPSSFGAV